MAFLSAWTITMVAGQQAFRPRRAHVVLRQHVDHAGAQQARQHGGLQRAERDRGHDERPDVVHQPPAAASDEPMPVIGSQSSLIEKT
jgi:hypothetical protein